jgi:hypothetical protein
VIGMDKKMKKMKKIKQLQDNMNEMSKQLAEEKAIENIASTYAMAIKHFNSSQEEIEEMLQKVAKSNNEELTDEMKANFNKEITEVADDNNVLDAREEKTIFTKMRKKLQKLWGKTVKNDTKNIVKDKNMSNNFKKFDENQIANINTAIDNSMSALDKGKIIKFFKIPVIRYILYHSIFSKFKKTFIKYTDKISSILMELTDKTGTVRLGKTLGSKVRDALYQKKGLYSSLTILVGVAYRKNSKNIEKIKNDTVNHLNSITKKLKKEAEVNANEFENKFDDCQDANGVIKKLTESYGLILDYCELGFVTGKDGIDALTKMLKACDCFKKFKIESLDKSDKSSVSNILNNIGEQINKLELNTIKKEKDPSLELNVDELDKFLKKSKKIKIESPEFKNFLEGLEDNAKEAQKNPKDKEAVSDFRNQIVEFYDFTKENINKIVKKEEAKNIKELNKGISDIFEQDKEINQKCEKIEGDLIQFEKNNNNKEGKK